MNIKGKKELTWLNDAMMAAVNAIAIDGWMNNNKMKITI